MHSGVVVSIVTAVSAIVSGVSGIVAKAHPARTGASQFDPRGLGYFDEEEVV